MLRIELLIEAPLGEGPLWDVGEQRLYWIDSLVRRSTRAPLTAAGGEHGMCPSTSAPWRSEQMAGRSLFAVHGLGMRGGPEPRFAG
jgi:sugar lactone lactonase YvrE